MSESIFKENLFEGKKVFITGGATGMGLGFAKAFLEHGADVLIASRKEENLSKAASEITTFLISFFPKRYIGWGAPPRDQRDK